MTCSDLLIVPFCFGVCSSSPTSPPPSPPCCSCLVASLYPIPFPDTHNHLYSSLMHVGIWAWLCLRSAGVGVEALFRTQMPTGGHP